MDVDIKKIMLERKQGVLELIEATIPNTFKLIRDGEYKTATANLEFIIEEHENDTAVELSKELLKTLKTFQRQIEETGGFGLLKPLEELICVPEIQNAVPIISEREYLLLKKDIEEHGIRKPLVVTETYEVLDGYTRLHIAKALGKKVVPVILWRKGGSLIDYALAVNIFRRHLSGEEIDGIISRMGMKMGRPKKGEEKKSIPSIDILTTKHLGEVAIRKRKQALKIKEEHPELKEMSNTKAIETIKENKNPDLNLKLEGDYSELENLSYKLELWLKEMEEQFDLKKATIKMAFQIRGAK